MIKSNISVTILTKNSEKYLAQVLESVRLFDQVLIYDNGSTDNTLYIASQYRNVEVRQGDFFGFGPTHNVASNLAKNDWILSIDSDEVVTDAMVEEILSSQLEPGSVYSFPRKNYFNGKWIKWCGWHPDRQVRLYNRKRTQFSSAMVHEAILIEGMHHKPFRAPLIHYSYESLSDFLQKMQTYSNLFADQNRGKRASSPLKAIFHSFFAFFKSYLIKRGFMGGYEGFVISVYNAQTAFYKYLKLYEVNQKASMTRRKG